MKSSEEFNRSDSYFAYQSDIGLVQKTYYSATKNPHTYFFIHGIGTLIHTQRSKNAAFVCEQNLTKNCAAIKYCAYNLLMHIYVTYIMFKRHFVYEKKI